MSKWERAEASLDTDNLICLAKLYNVSLDYLLQTEDSIETIKTEQIKKEEVKLLLFLLIVLNIWVYISTYIF